jgi:Flp pilus assembly pilin Flp
LGGDESREGHEGERKTMLKSFVNSFAKEEDGQDLVEYSLLLAFIALAATAFLGSIKASLVTIWTNTQNQLKTAASAS